MQDHSEVQDVSIHENGIRFRHKRKYNEVIKNKAPEVIPNQETKCKKYI